MFIDVRSRSAMTPGFIREVCDISCANTKNKFGNACGAREGGRHSSKTFGDTLHYLENVDHVARLGALGPGGASDGGWGKGWGYHGTSNRRRYVGMGGIDK